MPIDIIIEVASWLLCESGEDGIKALARLLATCCVLHSIRCGPEAAQLVAAHARRRWALPQLVAASTEQYGVLAALMAVGDSTLKFASSHTAHSAEHRSGRSHASNNAFYCPCGRVTYAGGDNLLRIERIAALLRFHGPRLRAYVEGHAGFPVATLASGCYAEQRGTSARAASNDTWACLS